MKFTKYLSYALIIIWVMSLIQIAFDLMKLDFYRLTRDLYVYLTLPALTTLSFLLPGIVLWKVAKSHLNYTTGIKISTWILCLSSLFFSFVMISFTFFCSSTCDPIARAIIMQLVIFITISLDLLAYILICISWLKQRKQT